jgi:tripartite-type tricarboxylate transporter receptor subunit TctC
VRVKSAILSVVAFGAALAVGEVAAQDWPNRPLTMVVPFKAAGIAID